MASPVKEGKKRIRQGDKLKDQKGKDTISTPVLVFTDAETRNDLYAPDRAPGSGEIPPPDTANVTGAPRPLRKRTHLANLMLQSPSIPSPPKRDGYDSWPSPSESLSSAVGIGLAVGSPGQSPWAHNEALASSSTVDSRGPSPLGTSAPVPPIQADDGFKDRGRWNFFGALFNKKPASNPTTPAPFYKAQVPKSASQMRYQPTVSHAASSKHRRVSSRSLDNFHSGANTTPISTAWKPRQLPPRPPTRKAPTAPAANSVRSPPPPPKDYVTKPLTVSENIAATQPIIKPKTRLPVAGDIAHNAKLNLLAIDIPDVSMERYSIMFGDVLKPRQSLLARRHGQLPQLTMPGASKEETCKASETHHIVRRATVPSPTFSLFPLPPSRNGPGVSHPPVPRPLQRSATAPAVSPRAGGSSNAGHPKRQDSRVRRAPCSPSQSSDTPVSLHDQWHSDHSPVSTVASEEEDLDDSQLQTINPTMPELNSMSIEDYPQSASASTDGVELQAPIQLLVPLKASLPARSENKPRTDPSNPTPHERKVPNKQLPSPPIPREPSSPSQRIVHTAEDFRQIMQLNPLKSAPASAAEISIARKLSLSRRQQKSATTESAPASTAETSLSRKISLPRRQQKPVTTESAPTSGTEISLARKISLSRRQQMLVPVVPKAVQQRQLPKLVNPDDLPEPPSQGRKISVSRARERSQYIVLETV